jgi:iron complex outermembrane recepter protein
MKLVLPIFTLILSFTSVVSIANAETTDEATTDATAADTLKSHLGDEIIIIRTRADRTDDAVAFSDLAREEIARMSYGQDVPLVLSSLPSVYAYSDAGGGSGYSYLQIRGFNQDRIGMMLNGVPLNDPEAHSVYWVDHGDLLADAASVQVQRGIGATLFGATSFGGSVNVLTSPLAAESGLHLETGYGDYTDSDITSPSRLLRAAVVSGPLAGGSAAYSARYSRLDNEGYREASGSNQEAFSLSAVHSGTKGEHKLDIFSGSELTHFAWDGIIPQYGYDLDDREDRRYNYYGSYKNNVDNFDQIIASLSSSYDLGDRLSLSNTFYYIKGDGFYEQYKSGGDFWDYGIDTLWVDSEVVTETDLVRRRWLRNDHWGVLPQLRYEREDGLELTGGLGYKQYKSIHYGELIWTDLDVPSPALDRYYEYNTEKITFEAYGSLLYPIATRTSLSAALQYQGHRYDWRQEIIGNFRGYEFDADHDFLSPRLGLRHHLENGISLYGSASYAEREPSDNEYIDSDDPGAVPAFENAETQITGLTNPVVEPEKVYDFELGGEFVRPRWHARVGLYRQDFRDELIPIDGGRVNEDNELRKANAEKTVHQGIEFEGGYRPMSNLTLRGNLTLARHRYVDHEIWAYWLGDYAGGMIRYDDNVIPRSPEMLGNLVAELAIERLNLWAQYQFVGKQYIDGVNTEEFAIDSHSLINLAISYDLAARFDFSQALTVEVRINNLLDDLYETYGYAYYDDFPPAAFSAYWPAATRSVYVSLKAIL